MVPQQGTIRVEANEPVRVGPLVRFLEDQGIEVSEARSDFPIDALPVFLKPLSYALPLTYGADLLHGAVHGAHTMPFSIDLAILAVFCIGLFMVSLHNIRRRRIA
jgi:uncharacterized phage infection (PIP) family protein YhgE